jgi:geranylgeranyl diphosphate synthase type I
MMKFSEFSAMVLPKIEQQMKSIISLSRQNQDDTLFNMLCYHLGWEETKRYQGKRIRPLFLLLTTETAGGSWENAVAAAASVELIHNFSLIHDDIEDKSHYRRGRQTLWITNNLPLALNAGDAMFALSFISLGKLSKSNSRKISLKAFHLLSRACLLLTKGQHLDISFEALDRISVYQYLEMIEGKTAALLAISSKIGAMIADADPRTQELYYDLGKNIGLAFQINDDILGIWGNPEKTGKSAATDLLTRKKTLPILFGLSQNGIFKEMWESEMAPEKISILADQLRREGAYEFAINKAEEFTKMAVNALDNSNPTGPAVEALEELIQALTTRKY